MQRRLPLLIAVLLLIMAARPAMADPADALIGQGVKLLQAGRVDQAIAVFFKAVQVSPRNALAHNNLGFALETKGDLPKAIAEYTAAFKLKPDYKDARDNLVQAVCGLARQLGNHGDLDSALGALGRLTAQFADAADAWYTKGCLLKDAGRDTEALEAWKTAATLHPNSGISHYLAASQRLEAHDLTGAIEELTKAIQLTPKNPYAHNLLGIALANSNQLDAALKEFQTAIKLEPSYVTAWINVGEVEAATNHPKEAIEAYQHAAATNPHNAPALVQMANVFHRLGDDTHALECVERAVKLAPDSAPARLIAGLVYIKLNRPRDAFEQFQKGQAADPQNPQFPYALIVLYVAAGDKANATRTLAELKPIDKSGSLTQKAEAMIQAMGSAPPTTPTPVVQTPTPSPETTPVATTAGETRSVAKEGITVDIPRPWIDLPLTGDDNQNFSFKAVSKSGTSIWLRRPKPVPSAATLKQVADYVADESSKLGYKPAEQVDHPFGGKPGLRYMLLGANGDHVYLYVTLDSGVAYAMLGRAAQPDDLATFERIAASAQFAKP